MNKALYYAIPVFVFFLIAILFFSGLGRDPRALPSALINRPLPHFTLSRVLDSEQMVSEKRLPKQIILLNVFSTWCLPCREEHAQLLAIAQTGIPIIGLNWKDNRKAASQWLNTLGNPYQFAYFDDKGDVAIDLGVSGVPETFVIDAHGIVRYRYAGALTKARWQQVILPVIQQIDEESG